MRKQELLKRIEELEKAVAVLQQEVSEMGKKPISPTWIAPFIVPWIAEEPLHKDYIFTCAGDSTSSYTV